MTAMPHASAGTSALFDAQRLAAMIEGSDDAIISKSLNGVVNSWNAGATRIFGYSAPEMIGQSIERIIPPDLRHEEREIIAKLARGEHVSHYETTRVAKDGRKIAVSLSVSPLRDARGRVIGASKIARDITERKQADAQRDALIRQLTEANARAAAAAKSLAESERFTAIVLDASPDLLAYWNSELRCRFANKAFSEWFGKNPRDLIGSTVLEAFGESLLALAEPYILRVLRGEKRQVERAITTVDGRVRQTLTSYSPDIVDGEVVGFIVQVSDVTPLKDTEAALRAEIARRVLANQLLHESRVALQEAQRVGQIGSWDWDIAKGVISWSDELYRMFELDPASAPLGFKEHAKYFLPDSWARLRAGTKHTLKTGEPYSLELQLQRPSGAVCWMEARGEAVRGESARIIGLRGTTQDITSRKQADEQRELLIEQLTAASEERAHFAHAASHDLKEPLRMVEAFCKRLQRDYVNRLDARGVEYLSLAVGAASRMSRMLNDLVDFDRVAVGARGIWFDARTGIDRALANLDDRIRECGASIDIGPMPRIYGNATRFERLMQNLIGNGLKYVEPGVAPRIALSAAREGEFWRFSVADNGIGIDPRFHERIFEPFKRLHAKDRYDGSGLGLTICRKIVEGFGGTIRVDSHEGDGSTFSFTVGIEREEGDGERDDA